MRAVFLAPLVVLAATAFGIGTSVASPLNSLIEIGAPYYDGYQPADCHNFTHNHYVPEWGIEIPHHHSQFDCRPIRDENDVGRMDRTTIGRGMAGNPATMAAATVAVTSTAVTDLEAAGTRAASASSSHEGCETAETDGRSISDQW